jgi:hypothetical protein
MGAPWIVPFALMLVVATTSVASAPTELTRATLAGGGGRADFPTLSMGYTIGQPVVGLTQGSNIGLHAGFWAGRGYTVTAVDDASDLPAAYRLHPNAPNPFNPRTEIRFDLPEPASHLSLSIYDVAGRRVATLAEGPHAAGFHRVIWSGEDDAGRPVASGVYLYHLESPAYSRTAKLALVR